MSRNLLSRLTKAAGPFEPTKEQDFVKSRLKALLEEHSAVVDVGSITLDDMVALTGCEKIRDWAKRQPHVLTWLLDLDYTRHMAQAEAEASIRALIRIRDSEIDGKMVGAKDVIKASELLLQVADRFPAKHKVIEWKDKDVGKMSEEEIERAIASHLNRLSAAAEK